MKQEEDREKHISSGIFYPLFLVYVIMQIDRDASACVFVGWLGFFCQPFLVCFFLGFIFYPHNRYIMHIIRHIYISLISS